MRKWWKDIKQKKKKEITQAHTHTFSDTPHPTQRRSLQMLDVAVPQIGVGVFHAWLFHDRADGWVSEVFVSTDGRRACRRGAIGSTMGAHPGDTGSNPVEGNGRFFPSYRQLYLSSISDTHTHLFFSLCHTHTHLIRTWKTHAQIGRSLVSHRPSYFFSLFFLHLCLILRNCNSLSITIKNRGEEEEKKTFHLKCLTGKSRTRKKLNMIWGLCALRNGIQISMEAILACHPALSTKRLD